jgi:TPR repeat protein
MRDFRGGLLASVLYITGCDADAGSATPKVEAPPVAPKPVAAAAHEAPEREPEASEQPVGECATSESCAAAASHEERLGHPERAASLYARACDLGVGQACHRLGELYRDGQGVAPDDDRAHALFEQGCRQGSSAACDALGH